MYIDNELLLSDAQSLSGTAVIDSTSAVDLMVAGRDVGKGEPLSVVVVIDGDAGGTSPTLVVRLVTADDSALDTNVTIILETPTIVEADLKKGRNPIHIPIPMGIAQRYLGLNYLMTGTSPTLTVTAFVTSDVQTNL